MLDRIVPNAARDQAGRHVKGTSMFLVHCPAHGKDVLLGLSRLRGLVNVRGLIVLELECYDGQRIVHLTGRQAKVEGDVPETLAPV